MKHILRHGKEKPTVTDLSNRQLGIAENSRELYIRLGEEIVLLNNYSKLPLEQEETRVYAFSGDDESNSAVTDEIIISDDLTLRVARSGFNISKIMVDNNSAADITVFPIAGQVSISGGIYNLDMGGVSHIEHIINISNTYAIKVLAFKSTTNKMSNIIVDFLTVKSIGELEF